MKRALIGIAATIVALCILLSCAALLYRFRLLSRRDLFLKRDDSRAALIIPSILRSFPKIGQVEYGSYYHAAEQGYFYGNMGLGPRSILFLSGEVSDSEFADEVSQYFRGEGYKDIGPFEFQKGRSRILVHTSRREGKFSAGVVEYHRNGEP